MAKRILRVSKKAGHGFGTSAVFLTSICTILGAIMFLRFGYAVGNLGLLWALLVIIVGHLITIPTGLALSEIATNLKVGGGGEYYIISRSFGTTSGDRLSSRGSRRVHAVLRSVSYRWRRKNARKCPHATCPGSPMGPPQRAQGTGDFSA